MNLNNYRLNDCESAFCLWEYDIGFCLGKSLFSDQFPMITPSHVILETEAGWHTIEKFSKPFGGLVDC